MVNKGHFGIMVASQNEKAVAVPLEKVAGYKKLIPAEHSWLDAARQVGTNLGD